MNISLPEYATKLIKRKIKQKIKGAVAMTCVDKLSLRKIMRAKLREYLGDKIDLRLELSVRIWDLLYQLDEFKRAEVDNSLMVYLNFQEEVETVRFVKLPVIIPFCRDGEIVPFRLFSFEELEYGVYGILSPKFEFCAERGRLLPSELVKVVIVPGLAFDATGNRLGRGKGFYDRFISNLPESTITIAICYEFQVHESIPVTESDKPVNIIVTENRIIY
ncbi:MAG: 5-formyltetrahydrofolate cyclo-ligase [Planctomycetaceae bacterium]|nr:5-formyltetrahydrofolate cyclo-ligase [Planctomycetaceae bacterium]